MAAGARGLILSGPLTAESYPLIWMAEHPSPPGAPDRMTFIPWNTPDQVRTLLIRGEADIAAVPTAMAANLFNRGLPVQLADVSFPKSLWIVSTEPGISTLKGMRGKTIAMPFRGDMPEIIFSLLAHHAGLDMKQDLTLRYPGTPMDAVQQLLMGRVNHAFLGEPAVSAALVSKDRRPDGPGPVPYCSVNMQEEWKRYSGQASYLPLACTLINGSSRLAPDEVALFRKAYRHGARQCAQAPEETARLVAGYFPMLKRPMLEHLLQKQALTIEPALRARATLDYFFNQLLAVNPRVIGGKLPGRDFYWSQP